MKIYPTYWKPWGLAINEAMQFGKPVIATFSVSTARNLVRQEIKGFVVPENNDRALAEAIRSIILDEELAKKMRQKFREIILQTYNCNHLVKGFIESNKHHYTRWQL